MQLGKKIYVMLLGGKKCILQECSLMPDQNEDNNHTSKINVFPVSHTIFFQRGAEKMDLFPRTGE